MTIMRHRMAYLPASTELGMPSIDLLWFWGEGDKKDHTGIRGRSMFTVTDING